MALQRMAEKAGEPLEIAICIGLDPIVMLSSQAIVAMGFDEFGIAGALYGKPVELVKGETVDVEYPAHAEIVLEGKILPNVRKPEGPFGEYPKYYGPQRIVRSLNLHVWSAVIINFSDYSACNR